MGVSGSAPGGQAKARRLVARTGVASVLLLAAASLAASGCASSTGSAGVSNCTAKHGAAGAAKSAPGGSAGQGVASAWTLPGADMQNTRDVASAITASDVAHLGVAWCVPIESTGLAKSAGITDGYSTTPVVVNGVMYTQDIESNVMAIKLATGKVLWTHNYSSDNGGPDGVNVANGVVYAATNHAAVALSASTGKQLWSRTLIGNNHEGIDMAPGYRDGTVFVSTVPVNPTVGEYLGGGKGILWALNAQTGAPEWSFDEVGNLWGNPAVNSGGGLWEPPSFDAQGNIYIGIANPGPIGEEGWPKGYPLESSRPGPDLYTDSVVKLSPAGKLLWYYQLTPHDLYDWDLQNSPVLTTANGQPVVIDGGKAGILIELNAQTGKLLWKLPVGVHTGHDNDGLLTENATPTSHNPLPAKYVLEPGALGGIETPLASNGSTVFAAVNNIPFSMTNNGPAESGKEFAASIAKGTGEMVAVNQDTGKVIWDDKLPSSPYGAATVTNNVVFTTTYSGYLYAFNTATGAILLKTPLSSGSNAPVAIEGDYVLAGAGLPSLTNHHQLIIAYKLGATGKLPVTVGR
ncbi:MAG TPA: PQQ-binding-like beta-propeller repeat protein [Streptosporangiaceae bacterium]|nr:PQQ-binding-like beta-propeller repeat protein [Streptosporangiaceae bacterium]